MYGWTQERRELDYLRFAGASDETAKEVKIFGLSDFFGKRFQKLAGEYYQVNRNLSVRRAAWGGLLSMLGSLGYYAAYAVIIYRTVYGELSLGDLIFLSGSFLRLRSLMEAILIRFSSIADSALYLRDLFDFLKMEPRNQVPRTNHCLSQRLFMMVLLLRMLVFVIHRWKNGFCVMFLSLCILVKNWLWLEKMEQVKPR